MNQDAFTHACGLIFAARRKKQRDVLIYLARTPGTDTPWPTDRVPVGRSAYYVAGRFNTDITLGELADELEFAERQMRRAA